MLSWTETEVEFLKKEYPIHGKSWCAEQLSRSESSIRYKASTLQLTLDTQSEFYKEFQRRAAASKVGKPGHTATTTQKEAMRQRTKSQWDAKSDAEKLAFSEAIKASIAKNGHPKGMLGKTHSDATKKKASIRVKAEWQNPDSTFNSKEFKQGQSDRMHQRNLKLILSKGHTYSRAKSGWYRISDTLHYFRSSWEVNYARYLYWMVSQQKIKSWLYEPDTFWFERIQRGVRSYTPDFKVEANDGAIVYHEVKGWLDKKSKTKLKRMRIYHPQVKMLLIDKVGYKKILELEKEYPPATFVAKTKAEIEE